MTTYRTIELHLDSSPLSHSQTRRIKAAGGKYSECRGYVRKRFVTVPASEIDLINELVRTHGGETMIARDDDKLPSWVIVQHVDPEATEPPILQFIRLYQAAKRNAHERGIISTKEVR